MTIETRRIYLTLKMLLLLIILTAINLSHISAAASQISFNFNNPVYLNEEFSVSIDYQTDKTYDVKIFIHNSSDEKVARGEILSEIFNSTWKDSWLYILSAFPEKKDFGIKISQMSDNAQICVQLRETGKTSVLAKSCMPIEIVSRGSEEAVSPQLINKEETLPLTPASVAQEQTPIKKTSSSDKTITPNVINLPPIQETSNKNSKPESESEIIKLSSPAKSSQQPIFSKTYYIEKGIIYSFIIFTALVIFFILARKI